MFAIASHLTRLRSFSLRTLFILMTLCCLVVGTWSVYVNPYRMQLRSLATVYRLQGNAQKSNAEGSGWQRWLVKTSLGEDTFVYVTEVDLRGCQVDDAALRSLTGLAHVETLKLDLTQITDDGIGALRSMPLLKTLHLRHTKLSDPAAATLAALPRLETVYLTGTRLTDDAVSVLAERTTMTTIFIRWTKITNAGAARLAAALPRCAVHHHALE
jgi:hypothetical protein